LAFALTSTFVFAASVNAETVSDSVVSKQRAALEANTDGEGFGPQSRRDIDQNYGTDLRNFSTPTNRSQLNFV
jgi:hypothetical protein